MYTHSGLEYGKDVNVVNKFLENEFMSEMGK